ncbi:MAG: hypothetical protein QNI87_04710 [Erythrobacter sp.]|uniref:hypothetical protein n=1 Tax=Erythrobacter sp. TaxID=1042 RepID=UPI00261D3A6C|nr:hypothetical protein [Erythrobacter sp.]MDJ0977816.1 hypothetical protein [Erythrobacter sp.]
MVINGATIALMMAGLIGFGVGAYLAATGERTTGIAFMGMGLIFQALTLRQLKMARLARSEQEGSSDAG